MNQEEMMALLSHIKATKDTSEHVFHQYHRIKLQFVPFRLYGPSWRIQLPGAIITFADDNLNVADGHFTILGANTLVIPFTSWELVA